MNKETFLYKRTPSSSDFTMWMAFPGPYSFSLSSLGYLWMFKTIDEAEIVNVERVCSDTQNIHYPPKNLIGFSFSFDMDFLVIFEMLEKYGIALRSSERGENAPLVFAGGPVVTANPLPYSKIFDFFVIGDGEDANLEAVKICKLRLPKSETLKKLAEVEGIYVPCHCERSEAIQPLDDSRKKLDCFVADAPRNDMKVKKRTKQLNECIYTPILSEDAYFKNTFIVEMSRGCTNRCGFCLASYLNLPLRCTPYEELIKALELGLKHTNKIALLGAQISAHPNFHDVCKYIAGKNIEMSVSSLRVDAITPDVVKTLVAAGQKNVTLAIEAGSERLRRVINKNLSEEQILKAIKICAANGLKGLKLYGMIGLPTETQEDIDALIRLSAKIKAENKGFNISFAFSTFVPKPHTPFQWCEREDTKSLETKIAYLRKELHKLGIGASFSSPKWDYYQWILSCGDESLGDYLIEIYRRGGKLGAFKSVLAGYKPPELGENLPWDFIDIKPGKKHLKNIYDKIKA